MFDSCIYGEHETEGTFLREVKRKARKRHKCCECVAPIEPGEWYQHAEGVYDDGRFWSVRTCEVCHRIRKSLVRGSFIYGELWNAIEEYYCKDREDAKTMLPPTLLKAWKYE
ncbi:MAG: hypothetical protein GTN75_00120 [Gemmatimonadetes bacterium]|nr:hypothetical protein [Gemmatimonadota bacterium]